MKTDDELKEISRKILDLKIKGMIFVLFVEI